MEQTSTEVGEGSCFSQAELARGLLTGPLETSVKGLLAVGGSAGLREGVDDAGEALRLTCDGLLRS